MYVFRYGTMLGLMALDIISGIVKVKRNNQQFVSSKMASGLYKKISTILCLVVADILAVISAYYLHKPIDITKAVYIYIVAMESISIYENCGQAGLLAIVRKFIERIHSTDDEIK